MEKHLLVVLIICGMGTVKAQDSLLKIHHAEPLYTDLIRDLGARKGEREWNAGMSLSDRRDFITYGGFVEYEFSPVNRVGLEVEVPFSFHQALPKGDAPVQEVPRQRVEGIKTAFQYTFYVSARYRMSMAAGYMNEINLHSFHTISERGSWIKGNTYNPFFIVAKRWSCNFHSMLYTGPVMQQTFVSGSLQTGWQANVSVHYVLPGTSHFVGMELNYETMPGTADIAVLHPQVKVKLARGLHLGLVSGLPFSMESQGLSFMMRFIYEPVKE